MCYIIALAPQVMAQDLEEEIPSTFTLYFENDTFFGTDYLYTNGVKLSWTSPDLDGRKDNNHLDSWAYELCGLLPFVGEVEFKRSTSLSIGQNMYTPEDTVSTELRVDDRPYAGIAYLEMGLYGKSNRLMNSWELLLGMVGPHSYAEDTQKFIHELRAEEVPQGWGHQLQDEPIINIFFSQRGKLFEGEVGDGLGVSFIPNWGAGFGNLFIGAHAGAQILFGWNLPGDFGTSLIRPGSSTNVSRSEQVSPIAKSIPKLGVYIFCGVDGSYVLRNLILDGNTFQSSHSVEKEPLTGTAMVGLGFTWYRYKLSFAQVDRSKEFKGQNYRNEYGSITLSFVY
ncbi:MAG: lipid A deacylase LpxR family protein [Proteobacteria bacterium]|nr:lipid A deacylase LpxR family protein [Pseudomonadota bacterium]MBU1715345.1 lipid A deacylase LpxR family protein [Pseudomonadota bacterium]